LCVTAATLNKPKGINNLKKKKYVPQSTTLITNNYLNFIFNDLNGKRKSHTLGYAPLNNLKKKKKNK